MNEVQTWNSLAGRYDRVVRLFDRSYPAIARRLASDLRGRASALEVAAGTGQFTLELARVVDRVVATDLSPAMVDRLGAVVRAAGVTNVEFATMSAYALAARDGSFDAVFCANALHVMARPERALSEFRRVLADDGVLIAPTFLHGADGARRALSRVMSAVSPFVAHARLDLDGLCELVEEAGFSIRGRARLPGLFPIGYVVAARAG